MKDIQLFCIPYAGGNASFFNNLKKYLEDSVEVYNLEYSGHGARRREPFYRDFKELLAEVKEQIESHRKKDVPYAIFGYSMGSLAAYELATNYFETDLPQHVFLAAHEPPDLPFRGKKYASLDDSGFLDAMEHFGGIDRKMFENQRFLDIFLPPMRADYQYLQDYHWEKGHKKIPCDVTVFYSPEDTKTEDMRQWERHVYGNTQFFEYSGNHFFLKEHEREIAENIKRNMENYDK